MMAWDAALKEMVLFSGAVPGVGFMYDTWTWDGTSWTAATGAVAGQTPPSRTFGTFFYDPISKSMILFGGRSQTDTMLSDTWSWNGGWTQLNPVHGPSPRSLASAVYDPALNATIMVGGWAGNQTFLQDTWAWTGSDWSILPISQGPPGSFGTVLGYRPSDHDLELTALGGGPVYLFDGKAWTVDTSGGSGGGCLYGAGAQDSAHSTLVVFGYCGTWIWDGTKWSSLSSADPQPPLRGDEGGSPMMADAPGIGVVLFSGRLGDQTLLTGPRKQIHPL